MSRLGKWEAVWYLVSLVVILICWLGVFYFWEGRGSFWSLGLGRVGDESFVYSFSLVFRR